MYCTNPYSYHILVNSGFRLFHYCCVILELVAPTRCTDTSGLLDNSRIRQLADCQLADWTTRGLDKSQTGQLADATGSVETPYRPHRPVYGRGGCCMNSLSSTSHRPFFPGLCSLLGVIGNALYQSSGQSLHRPKYAYY